MKKQLRRQIPVLFLVALMLIVTFPGHTASSALTEQEIYLRITRALDDLEDEIVLLGHGLLAKDILEIRNTAILNHPYAIYFDYQESYYWSSGRLQFKYTQSKTEIRKLRAALTLAVQEIIKGVTSPHQSELEKALALHDYLVLNTKYDKENAEKNTVDAFGTTAYGSLLFGTGVCSSYAKAYKLLLAEVGIESVIVTGMARGQLHAWNVVRINGHYYHVDVTWNDPIPDTPGFVRHTYFGLTDAEISKSHTFDASYPRCHSTLLGYFQTMAQTVKAGEWLVYRADHDENLYRTSIDGVDRVLLVDDRSAYLASDGEWIYYSNLSRGGRVFKVRVDGSGRTQLNTEPSRDLLYEDGWLYYSNWDVTTRNRMRTDGSLKQEITEKETFTTTLFLLPNGQTFDLRPFLHSASASVEWVSGNSDVALVEDGVVISGHVGSTTVLAHVDGTKIVTCKVFVMIQPREIILTLGQRSALVDGNVFSLTVAPYVNTRVGRTLVPLRFVSEALGAEVEWIEETRQVIIRDGDTEVVLTIGVNLAYVNGVHFPLDCPPELAPGTTFVPLRFISEALGAKVSYNDELKRITIVR